MQVQLIKNYPNGQLIIAIDQGRPGANSTVQANSTAWVIDKRLNINY